MYECRVIISDDDVSRLLIKHGFVKDKRMWKINGGDCRLSTQDALQIMVISAATRELEREEQKNYMEEYMEIAIKFDKCRGCLARVAEKLNLSSSPPNSYKGDWHIWLINQLDALPKSDLNG